MELLRTTSSVMVASVVLEHAGSEKSHTFVKEHLKPSTVSETLDAMVKPLLALLSLLSVKMVLCVIHLQKSLVEDASVVFVLHFAFIDSFNGLDGGWFNYLTSSLQKTIQKSKILPNNRFKVKPHPQPPLHPIDLTF